MGSIGPTGSDLPRPFDLDADGLTPPDPSLGGLIDTGPAVDPASLPDLGGQPEPPLPGPLSPELQESLVLGRVEVERELPWDSGWRGKWNDVVDNLEKLGDLRLAERAEKRLGGLIEDRLAAYAPELPAEQRQLVARELARSLREAKLSGVGLEELAGATEQIVADAGRWLRQRLTLRHTVREVRDYVASGPGLRPGEDLVINERRVKPAAQALTETQAELEVRSYAKGRVKVDWKKLFGQPDELIDTIDTRVGIRFKRDDFRSRVEARLEWLDPIDREGARVRLRGLAELETGRFAAALEGQATVESIYRDPHGAGTADLQARLRYRDERIAATLTGNVRLPLESDAALRWDGRARLDSTLVDRPDLRVSGFAEGYASGGEGIGTDYGARVGLRVRW